MEPTGTTTQTNTEYASYLYTSVNALAGLTTCTGAQSPVAPGKTLRLTDHCTSAAEASVQQGGTVVQFQR